MTDDESLWHKCWLILPRLLINGKLSLGPGQVWRRKVNGKWQYRQDEETDEEFLDRQW